jgi:hypothetical protein
MMLDGAEGGSLTGGVSKEGMIKRDEVPRIYLVRLDSILVATRYNVHLLSDPLAISVRRTFISLHWVSLMSFVA